MLFYGLDPRIKVIDQQLVELAELLVPAFVHQEWVNPERQIDPHAGDNEIHVILGYSGYERVGGLADGRHSPLPSAS